MKEVEIILRHRLKRALLDRDIYLVYKNYYLWNLNRYKKTETNFVDYERSRTAHQLSVCYENISLYRDEIKVLVKVLKIIKKKQGAIK